MEYGKEKVDEVTLALLYLTTFQDGDLVRAWKGMAWETMDRLFEKGLIFNPKGKAKSVVLTKEGTELSENLFSEYFSQED